MATTRRMEAGALVMMLTIKHLALQMASKYDDPDAAMLTLHELVLDEVEAWVGRAAAAAATPDAGEYAASMKALMSEWLDRMVPAGG